MRKLTCIAVMLAMFSAVLVASAVAGTHSPTSIKLNKDKTKVKGQIDSSKKCEKGRKVDLYVKKASGGGFKGIDESLSDPDGSWVLKLGKKAKNGDRFYVKVRRDGNCSASKSDTIEA